jgi:AICAR transformylase/IMP cyclohydrolase PurH
MNLKVPFDMDKVLEQMVESYDRAYKKAGIAMAQAQARAFNQAKDSSDTLDYDKIIEEAEAKELEMSKTKGVDVKGGL